MNLDDLNPPQCEAVLHTNGPLIIFAGAGTGKTRAIVYRIAHLLETGISPYSILGVTFTNKAAQEMKNRVQALSPAGSNVWISTFHSFCAHLLRVEAQNIGLNPNFLIYDYPDQRNLIKDCIRELNIDEKKLKPSYLVDKISRAKDELKTPEDFADDALKNADLNASDIAKVYKLYQSKLQRTGALDFGDLIMLAAISLKNNAALLSKYQDRFRFVLVDEYQDTNYAQYVLTNLIAQKHKNIAVVGDDDQSVYSWRGADISNILNFENDYPGAKVIKLEQNYRSTPKILKLAWNVIQNNVSRVSKKLWTNNADDGSVNVIEAFNESDEALKTANIIHSNVLGGASYCDFAVFYRTNAQSRVFEDAFRRSGIPYCVVGTLKFYDRAEIKDITCYLKVIHNPHDDISLKRIINNPKRSIGKTSVDALSAYAARNGLSLWQAIDFVSEIGLTPTASAAIKKFADMIKGFIALKDHESVNKMAQMAMFNTGYVDALKAENTIEAKSKTENLEELISAIEDFESRSPDKSLAGYLTQIALISDIDSVDNSKGAATLMTLHLAKGLEFDNVFVCGLEEGLFPIGESAFDPKELEEERRLMYVGMTRARKNLYLSYAAERMIFGKTRQNVFSRFLTEAGLKEAMQESFTVKRQAVFGAPGRFASRGVAVGWGGAQKNAQPKADTDSGPYAIGSKVKHPVFGIGKIIDKSGSGFDLKLVVLFENGQWKKLLAKAANLSFC